MVKNVRAVAARTADIDSLSDCPMMDQDDMRKHYMATEQSFTVVLEPLDEGGFLVLVPSLPEVVTHGETEEEAMAMAEDAIRLALGYRRDEGEPVPAEHVSQVRQLRVALTA